MNIKCPNKTLPEWKELVEVVGENQAYYLWDQNNGYGLDRAPNGAPSKLFSDLLSHYNGDRNAAITAKAKVYSEAFKNWFGNWLADDKINVSKVVDENGEPRILWHGTNYSFNDFQFDVPGVETHKVHQGKGFFFTDTQEKAYTYGSNIMPVFLNLRNPGYTSVRDTGKVNNTENEDAILNNDEYDSAIFERIDKEGGLEPTTQWVAKQPNQIKYIDNPKDYAYTQENGNVYLQDLDQQAEIFRELRQKIEELNKQIQPTYERIQKGLKDRLKAVKRYSTKNPRLWNQLSTVISQLANSEAEQGILQFLQHISDTISDAVKFLQKPIDEINAKQIRQLSQDYVGFYKPLLDDILYLFDTTDIFKDLPNYVELQRNAQRLSTEMDQVYNRFIHLLKAKGISELVSYLQSNNVPQSYIDKTLEWLNNPTNDISIFINWFGMASNSNSMVTQAIAKMLNDTMNQTQRETMAKGIELVKLAQVAKEKYGVDVQKLLYEKLNDGTYSGYRVRPINYGQYKKDKQQYLDKLANKLGITKDKEGHYNLPNDEAIQKKWFDGINKFYSERVNRRFTSEYYTTRNRMLSVKTRDAIDEIQDYIDSIVSRVTRDGIQHDEELTTSEYQQLLMLKRQKQLLANRYNLDGSIKTGDDLLIANELSAFNEEVNKNVKREVDQERYDKDYKAIVKQYGSKDDPRVKLWVYRNTITRYNQAFYDRLDSLSKTPQSDLYKELVQRRRELTQLFKDPETGQIKVDMLSDEQKAMLLQLDKDIDAVELILAKKR